MFHKRLADRIKAGFAWSVISEEGERIPANDHARSGESNNENPALNAVAPEIEERRTRETESAANSPWSMEKMFGNSERKFQPEFFLKKSEGKEYPATQEPPVKRPTAAFRVPAEQKGEVAIELPGELVQSSPLLAESAIAMSVSVLSAKKIDEIPAKKEISSSDQYRSIEFNFVSQALKGTG